MKFTYDHPTGERFTYVIEFSRTFRDIHVGVDDLGNDVAVPSTYPYTTVVIWQSDGTGATPSTIFRTYTVGCAHRDHFTREQGRKAALKLAIDGLSREFRTAVWKAYHNRSRVKTAVTSDPEII